MLSTSRNTSMMTSSNGNIFRVTVHLCREFTGDRWIPRTRTSDAELWCFLCSAHWINGWANTREAGDLRRRHAHYDVIVMCSYVLHLPAATVIMSRVEFMEHMSWSLEGMLMVITHLRNMMKIWPRIDQISISTPLRQWHTLACLINHIGRSNQMCGFSSCLTICNFRFRNRIWRAC